MDKETGWHLEAHGPVIQMRNGRIEAIRHNDLDRLPDLPPIELKDPHHIDEYYTSLSNAHRAWDELLAKDGVYARLFLLQAEGYR